MTSLRPEPHQAIILAGGQGTRLGPLTGESGKPMAEVGSKPFLEYLLLQLMKNGITDLVICTGHRGAAIREYFGSGRERGLSLQYSQEREPLGTGGALKLAERLIQGDTFLVMNGDSLFDIDIGDLFSCHNKRGARFTLALANVTDPSRYGHVQVDEACRVTRFVEKGQRGGTGLINAGVYAVTREVLDDIPPGRSVSLEREVLPHLVGRGLFGCRFDAYFVDIGTPVDLLDLRAHPDRLLTAVR